MLRAARAPVKPRFISSATGANLPLEDEVELWLDKGPPGWLRIVGGPGSGKSAALAHLAAHFATQPRLCIWDDGDGVKKPSESIVDPFMIFVGPETQSPGTPRTLTLAPWGRDELIEYLLAAHPRECGAVLSRVSAADEHDFAGVPELWRVALDELARDASLGGPSVALVRYVQRRVPCADVYRQVQAGCLQSQLERDGGLPVLFASHPDGLTTDVIRLMRHKYVRLLMAAELLASQLQACDEKCDLTFPLPRRLVVAVGDRIASHQATLTYLRLVMSWSTQQAMAASLLHAADPSWIPPASDPPLLLNGAYLDGVRWPGIRLPRVSLQQADLSQADLRKSKLDEGDAKGANLSGINLSEASLNGFKAKQADLSRADLSSVRAARAYFREADLAEAKLDDAFLTDASFVMADLRGASLRRAQLKRASFQQARLDETDFTGADLTSADLSESVLRTCCLENACLRGARLMNCDLEGMCLDGLNFGGARLEGALLTGSSMVGGNLAEACLRAAGLADVEWPGVCLRGADLRGATFHLGSSRSGLVDSMLASEGTRTGFYTDDFGEQDFKTPEEIRKANLCRADLHGACINNVDFYLVDLRGALYDCDQEEHFRRCGAILEDRCPP